MEGLLRSSAGGRAARGIFACSLIWWAVLGGSRCHETAGKNMETEENKHTTNFKTATILWRLFMAIFTIKQVIFLKILATFWAHDMRLQPNFPDGALDFLEVALMWECPHRIHQKQTCKVARLQHEFGHEKYRWAANFLAKNAPKFPPYFRASIWWARKNPQNFREISQKIPLCKESKYPPAQNQYMQEKILGELIFARIHAGPAFALARIQENIVEGSFSAE